MTEQEYVGRHRLHFRDAPVTTRFAGVVSGVTASVIGLGLVISLTGIGSPTPTVESLPTASTDSSETLSTVPGIDWVPVPASTVIQPPPLTREMLGTVSGIVSGESIVPGLWITKGGSGCVYSRNRGASWETGGTPALGVVVSLQQGALFDSMKCAKWTLYREY